MHLESVDIRNGRRAGSAARNIMEEENLEILNHNRVRLVEKVDTLVYVLRQRSKTVKDVTMALYEFMVRRRTSVKIAASV